MDTLQKYIDIKSTQTQNKKNVDHTHTKYYNIWGLNQHLAQL